MLVEELLYSLVWDIDLLSLIYDFFKGWKKLLVEVLIILQGLEEVVDV